MTLERPADVNDFGWNSVLANNEITASVWPDSSTGGWRLAVSALVSPAAGMYRTFYTTLASVEYSSTKRPTNSLLDKVFATLGLSRTDDWAEVNDDNDDLSYFECHLTLPESQIAEGRAYVDAANEEKARAEAERSRAQSVENFGTWRSWTVVLAVAGGLLNLLALAPLPATDYRLFRLGICAASVVLIFLVGSHKSWGWLVVLLPAAILWNPIFQFYFDRSTWAPLNIVAVLGFTALAYWAVHLKAPPDRGAETVTLTPVEGNRVDQP